MLAAELMNELDQTLRWTLELDAEGGSEARSKAQEQAALLRRRHDEISGDASESLSGPRQRALR